MEGRVNITVVAWNIRAGGGRRMGEIADQIRTWGADVVALSEFRATPPSTRLRAALRDDGLIHQISTADPSNPCANRLLLASRWPLKGIDLHLAPTEAGKWIFARVGSERPFAIGAMHIPNMVTGRKYAYHESVLDIVYGWGRRPAMLLGDTNSGRIGLDEESRVFGPREEYWMSALNREGWGDAFRELYPESRTYTWYSPNRGNGFRIDQAFLNRQLRPRLSDARYAWGKSTQSDRREALSDHAALIVDLLR